jgi:hypothetical protein
MDVFLKSTKVKRSLPKIYAMSDTTLHLRIKKEYAAALIEDLIKVHAVEAVEEEDTLELTAQQKEALDKELAAVADNPAYLQRWDDVKHRFKKP